ncbi:peptidoglycan-binding protein [Desertifilum sp. FACHB-1129]|uniref:Peptidoglycan-binding protein n=2 Tax=Desertifilum tharense IPPAS B-1220 TaxID=1781255 RepID=A0A1E5QF83_9CYAN|nr:MULTISPECIES: peptidoglycan-binding protein [Desertifilum]MDA0212813.1 peptidoglycan-binding protein [Cyanobacteria bacterium FC1]MBD2314479.1 peptidoglycan-binding protein [Desertifilum sp. FACHB-1129]MBD2321728.1 peptidoglycan-binding protein [Desertifilum sp. FACHB-866]MBD2331855.1 peptidoglycan-binding protein [Desertifilum sp. FACHB-868]OEJ73278.1 peptidoglycan-binding protein [Desertifilum tharense IPPAS B-1220]
MEDESFSNSESTLVFEACFEINEREANSSIRASFNGLLKDAPGESTAIANGLSQQLIHQINLILPNALVSCEGFNVDLEDAAFLLVQPPAQQALHRAIQERGKTMLVNSGYRTLAQQMLLFNWLNGISPVAEPGKSNHQSGLAIDIEDPRGWEPYLIRHGWYPLAGDPPHFDFDGGGIQDIRRTAILAFQKLWNENHPTEKISEDGAYGPQTAKALNRAPANGFSKAPWDNSPRVLRLSRPMMEGSDVVRLQEKLKATGIAVSTDGLFGVGTEKAVKEFQQKNNLKPDGIVGATTLEYLK